MFTTSSVLMKSFNKKGKIKYSDFYSDNGGNDASTESQDEFRVDRSFMTQSYSVNSWIRAIVDSTKERFDQVELFPIPLSVRKDSTESKYSDSIKMKMENIMNLIMKPNSQYESFSSLKKKVIGDILVYDEAGIQIVSSKSKFNDNMTPYELYADVSGEELFVNANSDGSLKGSNSNNNKISNRAFLQIRNGRILTGWNKYEFMNFIKNRRAGYTNGFSPIESIAASIFGDLESMNYNLKFFENNARPNIAFIFEKLGFGDTGNRTLNKAKTWYEQNHKGRPHLPLFMGSSKGDIKLQQLTVPNKDMEFSNWELMLLSRIMAVYGMQPMVLGVLTDTTGKLNSQVQTEQYKRNTIIPLVKLFTDTFNSVLIWGNDGFNYDDIYLTSANLDIDDEKKQSEIWKIFLETGVITINQVREELQMPPVDWGYQPFVPLNFSPLDILREYQLSRIESNFKNSMSDKIDNNLNNDTKKDEDANKEFLYSNYGLPRSGLDKIDPTVIKEACDKIIRRKDSRSRFFDYKANSFNKAVEGFDLSWKRILKTRV